MHVFSIEPGLEEIAFLTKCYKRKTSESNLHLYYTCHTSNFLSTLQSCVVSKTPSFLQLLTGGVNLIKTRQIQKITKFMENLL